MGKSLVIVSSEAVAKTLGKCLGRGFVVKASQGAVKELAAKLTPDFRPDYQLIPSQKARLAELRQAARAADSIYVAAEAGAAAEMLCHHLQQELGPINRIVLGELTPAAVQQAWAQPAAVNMNLVEAEHARLVLERLQTGGAATMAERLAEVEQGLVDWRMVVSDFQERLPAPAKAAPRPKPRGKAPSSSARNACPLCSTGRIVERRNAQGQTFYGCQRYPECHFTASGPPLLEKCPQCSSPYLVEKNGWAQCPNKPCGWKRELTSEH
jgi:hypothetical protein